MKFARTSMVFERFLDPSKQVDVLQVLEEYMQQYVILLCSPGILKLLVAFAQKKKRKIF